MIPLQKIPCLGYVSPTKHGLDKGELTCNPASPRSEERDKVKGLNVSKGLVSDSFDLKHQIDLNTCLIDEKDQLTPTSPIMKAKIEIYLEAPELMKQK